MCVCVCVCVCVCACVIVCVVVCLVNRSWGGKGLPLPRDAHAHGCVSVVPRSKGLTARRGFPIKRSNQVKC